MRMLESIFGWAAAAAFVLYLYSALLGDTRSVHEYQITCAIFSILSTSMWVKRTFSAKSCSILGNNHDNKH
jgi:hypothetical protein